MLPGNNVLLSYSIYCPALSDNGFMLSVLFSSQAFNTGFLIFAFTWWCIFCFDEKIEAFRRKLAQTPTVAFTYSPVFVPVTPIFSSVIVEFPWFQPRLNRTHRYYTFSLYTVLTGVRGFSLPAFLNFFLFMGSSSSVYQYVIVSSEKQVLIHFL